MPRPKFPAHRQIHSASGHPARGETMLLAAWRNCDVPAVWPQWRRAATSRRIAALRPVYIPAIPADGNPAYRGQQLFRFLHQPAGKHFCRPLIDARVERSPRRIEPEAQNAITPATDFFRLPTQPTWAAAPPESLQWRESFWACRWDECAPRRSGRAVQYSSQVPTSSPALYVAQPLPQRFRALRPGKQSVQQRAQIQSGSSGNDGNLTARDDSGQRGAGIAAIVSRGVRLIGRNHIEHVMGYPRAFLRRKAWRCQSPSRDRRPRSRN